MSYYENVSRFWLWFWAVLLSCAAIAGIIVGGWKLNWWLAGQSATNNYRITQEGTSNQDTLRAQIEKGYTALTAEDVQITQAAGNPGLVGQLKVEAAAQAGTLCQEGEQVNSTAVPLPADQQRWFAVNCTVGVVAPTSKYYIGTGVTP